jgi:hypothetical protein
MNYFDWAISNSKLFVYQRVMGLSHLSMIYIPPVIKDSNGICSIYMIISHWWFRSLGKWTGEKHSQLSDFVLERRGDDRFKPPKCMCWWMKSCTVSLLILQVICLFCFVITVCWLWRKYLLLINANNTAFPVIYRYLQCFFLIFIALSWPFLTS